MKIPQWIDNSAPRIRKAIFEYGAHHDVKLETHQSIVTWANGITLLRLLCLPLLVYLVVVKAAFGLAFVLLFVLALTDVADGYLARRLNQVTQLGTFIDPLTDRVTVMTVVLALAAKGIIPWWLCAVVLARDAILAVVIGISYPRTIYQGRAPIAVTRTGKLATMALFVGFSGFLLIKTGFGKLWPIRFGPYTLATFGVLLYYISLFQYMKITLARKKN